MLRILFYQLVYETTLFYVTLMYYIHKVCFKLLRWLNNNYVEQISYELFFCFYSYFFGIMYFETSLED